MSQVMGAVQGSLGKLGEVTQRVFDIGKDIAGLEQILRSPKVRGGLGESFLEGLLGQMLPREHYELQHAFATGDRVDAVVRIGGRLVPVDAKFPLENFRRLLDETDEDKRRAAAARLRARRQGARRRDRQALHPARRGHVRLRPHVHPGGERLLRDHRQGRRGGGRFARRPTRWDGTSSRCRRTASTRTCRSSSSGSGGCQIEKDAREIQSRLTRLRGDVDKFRDAFDVVGKHLDQCPEQVRRGGRRPRSGGGEARGDRGHARPARAAGDRGLKRRAGGAILRGPVVV